MHADGVLKSITFACGVYTFTNDKGEITITKDAQPNSLQDFSFTTTGTGLSNFTLDDDFGVPGASNTNSKTKEFDGLAAGTYTVTENATPGWYLDSITCNERSSKSIDGRTVTINLRTDEHVSCTFTNKRLTKIIVHKVTDPRGDPTSFPVSISANRGEVVGDTTGSISSSSDATFWVKPGLYDVDEGNIAGWKQVDTTCQNLVVSGEQSTKECTIYNEKLTGLTIIKDAQPDSAKDFHFTILRKPFVGVPQYFDNFTLDDDGNPNNAHSNQQTYTDINPGQYVVFEQNEPGWTLEGISCSEGTQYSQFFGALGVYVAKGQNPTCTFVNQRDTASIRVVKDLYPASDTGRFNLNIDGQTSAAAVGDGGDTGYQTVYTGTHSVSETAAEGTSLNDYRSSYVCTYDNLRELAATNVQSLVQNGNLQTEYSNGVISGWGTTVRGLKLHKNDHVTCTFTNKRIPTITIVKDAQPNSEQAFTFDTNFSKDFQLTDDGSQSGAEHQTFKVKNNKTYSFSEQTVNGWTLADVTCEGGNGESWGMDGGTLYVTPHWGDNIVCTFTNQKAAKVTIVKDAQPNSSQAFSFTSNLSGEDSMFALIDNGTNADLAKEVFTSVAPGTYTVKETSLLGWKLSSITCGEGTEFSVANNELTLNVKPGDDITCTFVNAKKPAGQVLGASTVAGKGAELPNTGQNPLVTLVAGLSLIIAAAAVRWFGRKPQSAL